MARLNKSRNNKLTGAQKDSLLHGHEFFGGAFQSEDDRRKAWEIHRAELLTFWTQDPGEWLNAGNRQGFGNPAPGGPGTRPAAWWDYDAPEALRIISTAEQIALEIEKRGEPEYTADKEHSQSFYYDGADETEVAYLSRLGLLSAGEVEFFRRLSPDPSDWGFLQRHGWTTAGDRRRWFLDWCRNLTPLGIESRRLDLEYLRKLGLSPVLREGDINDMHPLYELVSWDKPAA